MPRRMKPSLTNWHVELALWRKIEKYEIRLWRIFPMCEIQNLFRMQRHTTRQYLPTHSICRLNVQLIDQSILICFRKKNVSKFHIFRKAGIFACEKFSNSNATQNDKNRTVAKTLLFSII